MLRLVTASFIAALLVAPLGFGPSSSTFVANLARLLFAGLMLVFILLVVLAVHWSRRWAVTREGWQPLRGVPGTHT